MVNPPRALYASSAVASVALFLWMFLLVRFSSEWTFGGWMWRGMWPVVAMCVALLVAVAGAARARWWNYARWTQRERESSDPTP